MRLLRICCAREDQQWPLVFQPCQSNATCPCRCDGTRLFADVYRPAGAGLFPVILQRLPYDKTSAHAIHFAHPAWYARRGYVVVVQDVRGRWASKGEWYPFVPCASSDA
jgi:putative CocE/NonD family hydrolase